MKYSGEEYLGYFSVKFIIALFGCLPIRVGLVIGKFVGTLQYYLDSKHRAVAYKNIKLVFGKEKSPEELKKILRRSFQNFGQNFVELLSLGRINRKYVEKYIQLEGRQYIESAFEKGRGVIFSGIHAGSWELSNAAFGLLGYPFSIVARTQKNRLLNCLLDRYRLDKGYKVIPAHGLLRQIVKNLKSNEAVGLVLDHGALEEGVLIKFFGKLAYTPTGAIRLALKFEAPLVLGYIYRCGGPYHKLVMLPSFKMERTKDLEQDVLTNLERVNNLSEAIVRMHPEEYMWYYKRWKGSPQKKIIILNNGSRHNLDACLKKAEELKGQGNPGNSEINIITVEYKNALVKTLLKFCALFSNKHCQGCGACVKFCLKAAAYKEFIRTYADIVIAPQDLEPPARLLSRENIAETHII